MALSEDQKAMLRLLAQREQGYDDLAALMGLSVDEVRAKVAEALTQLEAEGEPVPPIPAPEPEAPAPAEPAASEPEPSEEEPPPPEPKEPPAAAPPKAAPKPKPAAAATPSGRPKISLPKDRGVQAAIGLGLLAIVGIVVLLIAGGSSGENSSASDGATATGTNAAAGSSEITQAILSPVEGGEGEGRAFFGRVKKQAALQVEATGLEPSPAGSAYAIWLYKSPKLALRIGAVKVGQNGGLAVQLPIPTELLSYVASGAFDQIDISLTKNAAYAAEVARSKKAKQLPEHVGTSVLRGPIEGPIIEKAEAEAEG